MNNKKKARIINACIENIQGGMITREQCLLEHLDLAEEIQSALFTIDIISGITFSAEAEIDPRLKKINLLQILPDREGFVTKRLDHRYRLQNLKRRFIMAWVVIVTTILSLISGAGAVYASNEALPGDILYPVKMWTENVQLAIAPDDIDMDLYFQYANKRIEEAAKLIQVGRSEDLGDAVIGYQLRTELLTQAMEHIQEEDPDKADRLRWDLEEKLQEQARIMQSFIEDEEAAEETDDQLREQIRFMLELNRQFRNRINDVEDIPVDETEDLGNHGETPQGETALEANENEAVKNNEGKAPSIQVNDETGTLIFGLGGRGGNGVYTEIDGMRYDCVVESDTATCNMDGAPQEGNVNLYDKQTNQHLYSYSYEFEHFYYYWKGGKNDSGNNGEQNIDDESGMETKKDGKGK